MLSLSYSKRQGQLKLISRHSPRFFFVSTIPFPHITLEALFFSLFRSLYSGCCGYNNRVKKIPILPINYELVQYTLSYSFSQSLELNFSFSLTYWGH